MLAKDPAARPADAGVVGAELAALFQQGASRMMVVRHDSGIIPVVVSRGPGTAADQGAQTATVAPEDPPPAARPPPVAEPPPPERSPPDRVLPVRWVVAIWAAVALLLALVIYLASSVLLP
jgi:hypothetical protein